MRGPLQSLIRFSKNLFTKSPNQECLQSEHRLEVDYTKSATKGLVIGSAIGIGFSVVNRDKMSPMEIGVTPILFSWGGFTTAYYLKAAHLHPKNAAVVVASVGAGYLAFNQWNKDKGNNSDVTVDKSSHKKYK